MCQFLGALVAIRRLKAFAICETERRWGIMRLIAINSGSEGNEYILESDTEALILDCGEPYKSAMRALNYDVSKIVGCCVTHAHG